MCAVGRSRSWWMNKFPKCCAAVWPSHIYSKNIYVYFLCCTCKEEIRFFKPAALWIFKVFFLKINSQIYFINWDKLKTIYLINVTRCYSFSLWVQNDFSRLIMQASGIPDWLSWVLTYSASTIYSWIVAISCCCFLEVFS